MGRRNKTAVAELIEFMEGWKNDKDWYEMFKMKAKSMLEMERRQIITAYLTDRLKGAKNWTPSQAVEVKENAEKYFNETFPQK